MQNNSEEKAIKMRKRKAHKVNFAYHLMRVFPINHKKIVFTAFEGDGGFCCNPRYIAEELLKRKDKFEIVWLVNNMEKNFPPEIMKVQNTFWNRVYHLSTAKVWVDNSRKEFGTAKRKGQFYIQTWHAGLGIKPIGKFRGKLFPKIAHMVSEYDSNLVDCLLSNSDWCTKFSPQMFLYNGQIFKTGSPRCDIFTNKRDKLYKMVRERYGVPSDAKIVMFAPTFRGGSQKGTRQVFAEEPTLDFARLEETLTKKYGGTWYIFLRLHPQLAARLKEVPLSNKSEHMVDVSQADDMNEVLAAMDVFITDYSSSAFDAANMRMPVFLYADDLKEYIEERGELMWDMYDLPFPMAESNDVLMENIFAYDDVKYRQEIDAFMEEHGVLEDGHASKRVVDLIERVLNEKSKMEMNYEI